MKLTDIKKDLKNRLSERRYVHSAGVAASAYILAEKYGYNPKKAELAGWLHDCAKEMKLEEMQDIIDEQNLQVDEYMRSSRALLHGPAGSIMAKTVYGIKDSGLGIQPGNSRIHTHSHQFFKLVRIVRQVQNISVPAVHFQCHISSNLGIGICLQIRVFVFSVYMFGCCVSIIIATTCKSK